MCDESVISPLIAVLLSVYFDAFSLCFLSLFVLFVVRLCTPNTFAQFVFPLFQYRIEREME